MEFRTNSLRVLSTRRDSLSAMTELFKQGDHPLVFARMLPMPAHVLGMYDEVPCPMVEPTAMAASHLERREEGGVSHGWTPFWCVLWRHPGCLEDDPVALAARLA